MSWLLLAFCATAQLTNFEVLLQGAAAFARVIGGLAIYRLPAICKQAGTLAAPAVFCPVITTRICHLGFVDMHSSCCLVPFIDRHQMHAACHIGVALQWLCSFVRQITGSSIQPTPCLSG